MTPINEDFFVFATDCEPGCAACVTVNGEASPVCTDCENILHVAQGVMCQESCAQGMYLRNGICYGECHA